MEYKIKNLYGVNDEEGYLISPFELNIGQNENQFSLGLTFSWFDSTKLYHFYHESYFEIGLGFWWIEFNFRNKKAIEESKERIKDV